MRRRDFLMGTAAASLAGAWSKNHRHAWARGPEPSENCCGPTYASPQAAMTSTPETLAYVPAIYTGTPKKKPDYMATIDVDPASKTYSQVVHRVPMPEIGDELHHFGWNACSSCHGEPGAERRYLIVPGLTSGNIHVIDVAETAKGKLIKSISGKDVAQRTDLSMPHTVHCLPDGQIMISMLGNAKGDAPGGFLLLNKDFEIAGRWEKSMKGMQFNYDFWYQPRHNVMISSEWAAPNTVRPGFNLDDVKGGKYGHRLQFWDWEQRSITQTVDLGEQGMIPLEVRFHHNPASVHGFVGAALSSSMWHFHNTEGPWRADKIIQVEPIETKGWPFPVPGLITDLVLSLDDRFLYFSNWLHGDIRQYDVSDPAKPKLTGQVWVGGVLGKGEAFRGKPLGGGPQMLQLSLDGRRLYVTNSLYSSWDNQFYPKMAEQGSYLLQFDCDTKNGGLHWNPKFYVDFGAEPDGAARAHEIRFPGGDSTSDIWV